MIGILLLFAGLMVGLIFFWLKERRVLKRKTSEVMSKSVWNEIVHEREAELKKRRAFREALEKAKSGIKD